MSDRFKKALITVFGDTSPKHFIDGEYRTGVSENICTVIDPSSGNTIASFTEAGPDLVEYAVASAKKAQKNWEKTSPQNRARTLRSMSGKLNEYREEIVQLEMWGAGMPRTSIETDIDICLNYLAEWPGFWTHLQGRHVELDSERYYDTSLKPQGVIARIVAYNHPFMFALAGIILPVLAGNAVVVKASEQAPLGTLAVAAIIKDILPAGLVNILGSDRIDGTTLVRHPAVRRVSLVGSLNSALAIQSEIAASGTLKDFSAELGGKGFLIADETVDAQYLAQTVVRGMSLRSSAGQSCQATPRVLVHSSLMADFLAALKKELSSLVIGPAYAKNTDFGPIISKTQQERIARLVEDTVSQGGEIIIQPSLPEGIDKKGAFFPPTVFLEKESTTDLFDLEVFGPVFSVKEWNSIDEAIELANQGILGLSGAIFSNRVDIIEQCKAELRTAYLWVNDITVHYFGSPFGGLGDSGLGREQSIEELFSFCEVQAVNTRRKMGA